MGDENGKSEPRHHGCGFGCLLALCIGLGLMACLFVVSFIGVSAASKEDGTLAEILSSVQSKASGKKALGAEEFPAMTETRAYGRPGGVKVVRIPLTGLIMLREGSSFRAAGNAETALRSIRRATADDEVMGIILDIDSGGGGITDSDILYHELKKFKEQDSSRVVVSLMGDVAASGAYYVALASDFILAHPTTLTGSIGVIMQSYNIKDLAAKVGVKDVTIKSGENKDLLNPFHDVKPEQAAMLQDVVGVMYERFLGLVAENRHLPVSTVRPLADGRVFPAQVALDHKLIDGIGYGEDARKKMAELLKASDGITVYRYQDQVSFFDLLARPGFGFDSVLRDWLAADADSPRMMYRWGK